jgi:hypothetical protein
LNAQDHTHRRHLLLALLVAAYYGVCCRWPQWMTIIGVDNLGIWFMDTRAVLAASDAYAQGLNPYLPNPLDLLHQPHVYSDWWFAARWLHLTRYDYIWVGALQAFTFLAVALLQLRVRSVGELAWSAALLCATPMVFAFNRGNADLLIFVVLSVFVSAILSPRPVIRWFAMAAVLAMAGLKFYPAIAGVLLLAPTRPRREVLGQLLVFAILLAAIGIQEAHPLLRYVGENRVPGFFTFGVGVTGRLLTGAPPWLDLLLVALVAGIPVFFSSRTTISWTPPAAVRGDYLRFILGAVMLTGCYFATINYAYRAVCAIWMGPFLWSACWNAEWPAYFRRLSRIVMVLLLACLWLDASICTFINLSHRLSLQQIDLWTNRLVLAQQPLFAALIGGLLCFIAPFVRDALRHLVGSRPTAAKNPLANATP